MKASQLKNIIRSIVKEEIEKSFKKELQRNLVEMITSSKLDSSDLTVIPSKFKDEKNSLEESFEEKNDKKSVKYTNNEILNQVLNETQGGLPQDGSMVGTMGGQLTSNSINTLNESVDENAPKEVKNVMKLINKDYSNLMSVINNKKGK